MRLFVGTPLPPQAVTEIERHVAAARPSLPRTGWVRAQGYHVTWAFIGELEESKIESLAASLHRLERPQIPIRIHGCGFFPSPRRPRVGWIGLDPAGELAETAGAVRHAIREARVSFDEKEFVPHLTLVRMRDPWTATQVEHLAAALAGVDVEAVLDHVSLFKSELHPEGARHTELARVTLRPLSPS